MNVGPNGEAQISMVELDTPVSNTSSSVTTESAVTTGAEELQQQIQNEMSATIVAESAASETQSIEQQPQSQESIQSQNSEPQLNGVATTESVTVTTTVNNSASKATGVSLLPQPHQAAAAAHLLATQYTHHAHPHSHLIATNLGKRHLLFS